MTTIDECGGNVMSADIRSLLPGSLLIAMGGLGVALASNLEIGAARSMGPGYFPLATSIGIFVCGVVELIRGARAASFQAVAISWSPLLTVSAAAAAFAIVVAQFGMLPAIFLCTLICGFRDQRLNSLRLVLLACASCAVAYVIFIFALNLPIKAWDLPAWN
jgi:hypothetical protein